MDSKCCLQEVKSVIGWSSQFKGGQKTNLIKALLENRGCRWISNSNSEVKR